MGIELSDTFDRARDEAAHKEHLDKTFLHNNGMAETSKSASVIDGASGAVRQAALIEREADKRRMDSLDTQALLSMLRAELQRIEIRRSEIGDMRAGIEDVFANGYEVSEDGKITNDQAEKALQEYETRTDTRIDRADETAVLEALHEQWEEFDREETRLNKRASEIERTINHTIPQARQTLADPNVSEAIKRETEQALKTTVNDSSFDGKAALDKLDQMAEVGHKTELNEDAQKIAADYDSYSNAF